MATKPDDKGKSGMAAPLNDDLFAPRAANMPTVSASDGAVIPFKFNEASVRVIKIDGEPWFVARDVALVLGYSATEAMTRSMDPDEKGLQVLHTPGGEQRVTVISEPGLYEAILRSRIPAASEFKRWVKHEVLPSIRKTGRYEVAEPARALTPAEMFLQNAQAMVNIERAQAAQAQAIAAQGEAMQRMGDEVKQIKENHSILPTCPPNAEPITKIRDRIGRLYGLPAWVVDFVVWESPYTLKPVTVRNPHADDAGAPPYSAYWVKDVSIVFGRFVRECTRVTPTKARHPFLEGRFNLRAAAS